MWSSWTQYAAHGLLTHILMPHYRDELCNHGQILKSKALEFTEVSLNSQLESGRSQRQLESEQEVEDEDSKVRGQWCAGGEG